MEAIIYDLLKNKKTEELIAELKKDTSLLGFRDSRGATLLMLGFYFRNKELSDYILSVRQPVDIYEAAIAGDVTTVKKFLSADRNVLNAHSGDGFTALGFACFFDRPVVAKYLLSEGADANIPSNNDFKVAPLHSSVAAKSLEITQMLLAHKANPNAKQQNDVTPLHEAAHNDCPAIARALLDAGADKTFKTTDGKTALDYAKEIDSKEIIGML
ncbi:MAG TPA: ankyrin repeat domain-containing protein [Cyclobacteriaceae bacterium]|nr:ankyrin repeat domain-containing protein [Cyclobacteriaceae bacterium]